MLECKIKKQINNQFFIDVDFYGKAGEITTLIGKSGAGKSTILNIITGLISLDDGSVHLQNKNYANIPVHLRQFGYIQQQSCLFPHLTVQENLIYSCQKVNQHQLEKYVEIFELEPHLEKRVHQISGGEAQRVSIVRTLMSQPKLLLLDEAFSALDTKLRAKLRGQMNLLKKELGIPIIFVTHDLVEAYEISDQMIVIDQGRLIEQGTPQEIFQRCRKPQTAALIGIQNIYSARADIDGVWIENYHYPEKSSSLQFQSVAIKASQIFLEKEGGDAIVQRVIPRLDDVVLELAVQGLSRPLIMTLSWREYHQWEVAEKKKVRFQINEFIYMGSDVNKDMRGSSFNEKNSINL